MQKSPDTLQFSASDGIDSLRKSYNKNKKQTNESFNSNNNNFNYDQTDKKSIYSFESPHENDTRLQQLYTEHLKSKDLQKNSVYNNCQLNDDYHEIERKIKQLDQDINKSLPKANILIKPYLKDEDLYDSDSRLNENIYKKYMNYEQLDSQKDNQDFKLHDAKKPYEENASTQKLKENQYKQWESQNIYSDIQNRLISKYSQFHENQSEKDLNGIQELRSKDYLKTKGINTLDIAKQNPYKEKSKRVEYPKNDYDTNRKTLKTERINDRVEDKENLQDGLFQESNEMQNYKKEIKKLLEENLKLRLNLDQFKQVQNKKQMNCNCKKPEDQQKKSPLKTQKSQKEYQNFNIEEQKIQKELDLIESLDRIKKKLRVALTQKLKKIEKANMKIKSREIQSQKVSKPLSSDFVKKESKLSKQKKISSKTISRQK